MSKTTQPENANQTAQSEQQLSASNSEKLYTQEEVDRLIGEAFAEGAEKTRAEFQEEIEILSQELAKKEGTTSISKKGLPQIKVDDEYFELRTLGTVQIGSKVTNAFDLIQDYEYCKKLVKDGSTLFQKVEEA